MDNKITLEQIFNGEKVYEDIEWADSVRMEIVYSLADTIADSAVIIEDDVYKGYNQYLMDMGSTVGLFGVLASNVELSGNMTVDYDIILYKNILNRVLEENVYFDVINTVLNSYVDNKVENIRQEHSAGNQIAGILKNLNSLLVKSGDSATKVLDRIDPNALMKYGQPVINKLIDKIPDFLKDGEVEKIFNKLN